MKFFSIHVIFVINLLLLQWKTSLCVDSDCNYQQQVEIGKTYYIYNPEYPNYTNGKRNCVWYAESPSNSKMHLSCDIDIPASPNCESNELFVSISGFKNSTRVHNYCGTGNFSIKSDANQILVEFKTNDNSKFLCSLKAVAESCDCGLHNMQRIVGGVVTLPSEFPMTVAILKVFQTASGDYDYKVICGGTIVGLRAIITAAHCFYNKPVNNIYALAGDWDLSKGNDTSSSTIYTLERVILHQEYNPSKAINDIAIFKTKDPIKYTMEIRPACLPFLYRTTNFVNKPMTLIGWGALQYGQGPSNILHKVNATWISLSKCKNFYGPLLPTQFCTYTSGKDACQGDSGGPALWQQSPQSRLQLLGVISYGKGCGSNYPGVQTNVINYLDWIVSQTPDETYCTKL